MQSGLASQMYMSYADSRARDHFAVGFDLSGRVRFRIERHVRGQAASAWLWDNHLAAVELPPDP